MTRFPPIPGGQRINPPTPEERRRLCLLKPFVRQTGDDQRGPWFLKGRKMLDYLLVYVGDGYGIFTVGEKTFKVGADDLIWIPPDTMHEMRGTSTAMRCIYIHFDLVYDPARSHWNAYIPGGTTDISRWRRMIHPPVDDPVLGNLCGKVSCSDKTASRELMKQICIEHRRSGGRSYLPLSGMMMQLLHMIAAGYGRKPEWSDVRWLDIQNSASKIRMSGDAKLDLAGLAAENKLSVPHFRRLFREVHGISPGRLHSQTKLRTACELLVYSKKNISEIAQDLGYSNIHNFSRAFTKMMKISPRNYRKGGGSGLA